MTIGGRPKRKHPPHHHTALQHRRRHPEAGRRRARLARLPLPQLSRQGETLFSRHPRLADPHALRACGSPASGTSWSVTRAGLRDRQTDRHTSNGNLQPDDSRGRLRPRPLLHTAARLTLGCNSSRCPDVGTTDSRAAIDRHAEQAARTQGAPAHSGQTKSEAGPAMPTSRISLASESAACSASVSGRQSDHLSAAATEESGQR